MLFILTDTMKQVKPLLAANVSESEDHPDMTLALLQFYIRYIKNIFSTDLSHLKSDKKYYKCKSKGI